MFDPTHRDEVGHATCGLAGQTLMPIYREWRLLTIGDDSWYRSISSSSNPIVRSYLAEQICLATIAREGLSGVSVDLGSPVMKVEYFEDAPDWPVILSDSTCPNPSTIRTSMLLFSSSTAPKIQHIYTLSR